MKQSYTLNDLTTWSIDVQTKDGQIIAHTHTVQFMRPLTTTEQQRFNRLMVSFYDVVYFSHRFGDGFQAEPTVVFTTADKAIYTLYQRGLPGPWKDLLFAMLATFSAEVVGIVRHDHSQALNPTRLSALMTEQII